MNLYDTSMSMHKKKENICLCSMGISPGASVFFHPQETLCHVGADGKYNLYVLEPAAARIEPVVNRDEQVGLWGMVSQSEPGSSIYIYYIHIIIVIIIIGMYY